MNRKLIRPNLNDYKEKMSRETVKKKTHPASETYAENYYYLKQMNKKTHVSIVFVDGETVDGVMEWYDRNCIKLNRIESPNLLIYKRNIKYILKLDDPVTNIAEKKGRPKSTQKKG